MKENCLFCKIIEGKIPSEKVYEDTSVIAFKDIHPKAPIHVLIVPRMHLDSLASLNEQNVDILKPLFLAARKIAEKEGVLEKGFRTVFNCNQEGGQAVYHLHLHLLAGKQLGGAMGS
ncbi:MAG: histidine triad nucleotide-binding protein [Deltaproteobacteria bacterium]|nr:histidine triad nucleotide-binding protein [Deltaproteobacteria bacterium]